MFFRQYKWLMPSLAFSCLLIVCRMLYTSHLTFVFLIWNLFLAVIPLYISHKLQTVSNKYTGWLYAAVWLLFFPNAMYITTDLFHLKERGDIPRWYDLLLLLSAALNGIIMGFLSLRKIEKWMLGFISRKRLSAIIFMLLLLCGYGIYLGRYERWNSWDIVVQPTLLLYHIIRQLIHPIRNIDTWILSTAFAIWMYLLYSYFPKIDRTGADSNN